jgi:hypothetical protein
MNIGIDLSLSGLTIVQQGGGAVEPFFSDDFVEAEATNLDAHTPETGTGWTVVKLGGYAGELQVRAGTNTAGATADAGNDGVGGLAVATYPSADYEVRSTWQHVGGTILDDRAGMVARYQDASNFYSAVYAIAAGDDMFLIKQLAGTPTVLDAADTDFDFTTAREVKFQVSGSTLTVLVDDVPVLSATDEDITDAGQGGFGLGTFMAAVNPDVDDSWAFSAFRITEL